MFKRLNPLWAVLVIFALAIVYLPGLTKYLKLKRKEVELGEEINRLKTEISKLRKEEHLMKTDIGRLEQVVREELGLVKPGEKVIKVIEEEVPQPLDPPKQRQTA